MDNAEGPLLALTVVLMLVLRRERHGDPEKQEATDADWRRASRAAGGVIVGYLASAVVQGLLGLASVILFALAYWPAAPFGLRSQHAPCGPLSARFDLRPRFQLVVSGRRSERWPRPAVSQALRG
jgi:hypothetical protein